MTEEPRDEPDPFPHTTMQGAPPGHPDGVYMSTACRHGVHSRCRLKCKYCPLRCVCPCDHLVGSTGGMLAR